MSAPPRQGESIARAFHETYERLALNFGYETRPESAVPWEDVPEQNKALMCAVAAEVFPWVSHHLMDLLRQDVELKRLRDRVRGVPHEAHCLAFENPAHESDCSCGIADWKRTTLGDAS